METTENIAFFPRELIQKFIQLYKEQTCLWDRKCPEYKKRKKRHQALAKLTALLQEHFPGATRVHALRKIESLRSCVRRERNKIRDSLATAKDPEDVYTPHLWYYDMCSFVLGEEDSNVNHHGKQAKGQTAVSEEEAAEDVDDHDELRFEQPIENCLEKCNSSTKTVEVAGNPAQKRYHLPEDDAKNSKRHCTEVDDEYDAIGINVAAKLRALPAHMRILAEKLINDVLFQAQINCLTSSTVVTTPDPFKQDLL